MTSRPPPPTFQLGRRRGQQGPLSGALRSRRRPPPLAALARAGRFGSAPHGVSAGLWVRKLEPNFSWVREEMGDGRGTSRAGCRKQSEGGTWARHAGRLEKPGRAFPRLGWGWEVFGSFRTTAEVRRAKALTPIRGRGRGVHLRPPWGAPPPSLESQRDGGPRPHQALCKAPRPAIPPSASTRRGRCCSGRIGRGARQWHWEREGPARPWPRRSLPQLRIWPR